MLLKPSQTVTKEVRFVVVWNSCYGVHLVFLAFSQRLHTKKNNCEVRRHNVRAEKKSLHIISTYDVTAMIKVLCVHIRTFFA